jgi:YD repeat-containing protein
MAYDNAGNLTNDSYTGTGDRSYDAENRMTAAGSAGILPAVYTYDGNGQRVRRNVYDVENWQVYGMDGELLAEYAANASAATPQKEYGYRNGQLLITAEPGSNSANVATYLQTDTTTQGNWKGVHGGGGYGIPNDAASYPSYAQVSLSGETSYTWAASSSDTRALLKVASTRFRSIHQCARRRSQTFQCD